MLDGSRSAVLIFELSRAADRFRNKYNPVVDGDFGQVLAPELMMAVRALEYEFTPGADVAHLLWRIYFSPVSLTVIKQNSVN